MIIPTCGHSVENIEDVISCCVAEWSRGDQKVLSFRSYCKDCYNEALKIEGYVLKSLEEENAWLGI